MDHTDCMKLTQLPFSLLIRCCSKSFPNRPSSWFQDLPHIAHLAASHQGRLAVCLRTEKHTLPCCCSPVHRTASVIQTRDNSLVAQPKAGYVTMLISSRFGLKGSCGFGICMRYLITNSLAVVTVHHCKL